MHLLDTFPAGHEHTQGGGDLAPRGVAVRGAPSELKLPPRRDRAGVAHWPKAPRHRPGVNCIVIPRLSMSGRSPVCMGCVVSRCGKSSSEINMQRLAATSVACAAGGPLVADRWPPCTVAAVGPAGWLQLSGGAGPAPDWVSW
jgi:hypothetical protein